MYWLQQHILYKYRKIVKLKMFIHSFNQFTLDKNSHNIINNNNFKFIISYITKSKVLLFEAAKRSIILSIDTWGSMNI